MNDQGHIAQQQISNEQMAACARGQTWPQVLIDREVAAEREACAALAESHGFEHLAKLIRGRSHQSGDDK